MLVIMDMDFTLVNTTEVERLRRLRQWRAASSELVNTVVYEGVHEMLSELEENGHEIVVLTNSPVRDARRLIEIHELSVSNAYYYKELGVRPKPDSSGHSLLIKRASRDVTEVVSVGDDPKDRVAAHGAGVRFIAAMWGARNQSVADDADAVADHPGIVTELIQEWSV